MARINTYNLDQTIRPEDLLVGSSLEGSFNGQPIYKTRNYRLDKLAEFFIGYDFNAEISLTTLEGIIDEVVVDVSDLDSALTALTNRVTVNESDISNGQSAISTLQGRVTVNEGDIDTLESSVSTITSNISNRANWDTAYSDSITSISVSSNETGSVKTISLARRSGSPLTASFADIFGTGSGGTSDGNNYVDGLVFNASTGQLTLSRVDLSDIVVSTFDDRYYTQSEITSFLSGKSDTGHSHTTSDITDLSSYTGFDARYYTETEINSTISGYLPLTGGTITGALISTTGGITATSGNITATSGEIRGSLVRVSATQPSLFLTDTDTPGGVNQLWGVTGQSDSFYIRDYNVPGAGTVFSSDKSGVLRAGDISSTNIIWHSGNDGADSTLDADFLDGLHATSFYRSNAANTGGTGSIQFNDNVQASFGNDSNMRIYHNGTNNLIDLSAENLIIRDGTTSRFTFSRLEGLLTLSDLTAESDSPTITMQDTGASGSIWRIINDNGNLYFFVNGLNAPADACFITPTKVFRTKGLGFEEISATVNANNFNGTAGGAAFMPGSKSIFFNVNSGATSANYPTQEGSTLFLRGNSSNDLTSFALHKTRDSNNYYLGDWDTTTTGVSNNWQWNRVVHENMSPDFGNTRTVTANNFVLSSDRRLKSDISDIEVKSNVPWRQFKMNDKLRYGVIADEVEDVYPELVYEGADGYKKVAYIDLLVLENQRLKDEIDDLKKDIEVIKQMLK